MPLYKKFTNIYLLNIRISANYNYVDKRIIIRKFIYAGIIKLLWMWEKVNMAHEDELLITYGLGYAFEKSKLLIVSEIEEKVILKKELDIMREINSINKLNESLYTKSDLKFPKNYIANVEEVLEEKVSKTIPIITSIKTQNTKNQNYLMDEYIKRDLSQVRLRREGYIQKDSTLIKEYLDNCAKSLVVNAENSGKVFFEYNKIMLKIILTTNFGNDFSNFLYNQGQAVIGTEVGTSVEEQLKYALRNEYLFKKKYNELDFLNLLLFLEEWQNKHFEWNNNYSSLMFAINKDGNRYKGKKSEIKDYVISFIKEKRYLYFPFGKYNGDNMFITLNDEQYCSKVMKEADDISLNSKGRYIALKKRNGNLYEITSNEFLEIDLEHNYELGYLLSYDNDNVYISLAAYDNNSEKIIYTNRYDNFKTEMIKVLEEHFVI
jgi:hypothetical protein